MELINCISCGLNKDRYLYEFKDKYNNSKFRKKCKECFLLSKKEKEKFHNKIKYEKNKKRILEKRKLLYQNNKERIKLYLEDNKEKIKKRVKQYKRNRRLNDPLYRLRNNISRRIRRCLNTKTTKTNIILGCSSLEFKLYLESKFESWMSWENYGLYNGELNYGWDIDHIIPLSSTLSEDEIIKLNHYTNLQPLDSYINRYVKRNIS
jgi:hypothetical protein